MTYKIKMNDATFYLWTGIAGALYTGFAALRYYSLSGTQLISAARAKKMIKSGEIKHVVDVRSKFEWDFGHYPGAVHMPVNVISAERLKKFDKNDGILTLCNTGQRARAGAEKIASFGFKNVYYIDGTYSTIL
jgi:rhodanese-related sulfurtransferase